MLPQLCRVLGVTADELLTGKTEEVKILPQEKRKSLDEMILRVKVNTIEGDKVRVNLPMGLVKIARDMRVDLSAGIGGGDAMRMLDLDQIVALVEKGAMGKLVEVETSKGDIVEVVVE